MALLKIDMAYPLNFAGADMWISIAQIFKQFQFNRLIKEEMVIAFSGSWKLKSSRCSESGTLNLYLKLRGIIGLL